MHLNMEMEESINSGFYLEYRLDGNFDNTSETEEEAACLGKKALISDLNSQTWISL